MAKIFGWSASNSDGCFHYRMRTPLDALAKAGHETSYNTTWFKKWQDADVLIAQRVYQMGAGATFINQANAGERLTVFEVDDDLMSVEPHNPVHKYLTPELLRMYRYAASSAQVVTVSTQYLANVMEQFNSNVHVVMNALPDSEILHAPVDQSGEHVAVGWQGSPTHGQDWLRCSGALSKALRANLSAVLNVRGTDYGRGIVEPSRYFYSGWVEPADLISSLDFQIGICPIQPTKFNASKSAIKVYEYWARGIVPIATKYGPYREAITHGVDGFLAKNEAEWFEYLNLLINDHALRQKMSLAGLEEVKSHVISKRIPAWEAALNV